TRTSASTWWTSTRSTRRSWPVARTGRRRSVASRTPGSAASTSRIPTAPPSNSSKRHRPRQTCDKESRLLLENKVAVITGIGPGLGRELAVQFAREGAAVAIGARTESYLEEVRKEVDADGGRVVAVPTDIADREQCDRIIAEAVDAFGGVDCVVQNGFYSPPFDLFENADLET